MKKAARIFLIFLFFFCALSGYALARYTRFLPIPLPTPTVKSLNQKNILLIHATSLQSNHPQLLSVWIAIITHTDTLHATFKLLYPGSPKRASWPTLFKLTSEKKPSDQFLSEVYKTTPEVYSYFLADEQALQVFDEWTCQFLPKPCGVDFSAPQDPQSIVVSEMQLLNNICVGLFESSRQGANPPNWNILIPDHFQSDLSLEEALILRDFLNQSKKMGHCKFIVQP